MVVATATAPPKFSIYIQQQTDGCEKMYEWRSRSNVALPVKLKSAGRLNLYEHISFSMHKILQGCVCITQAIPLPVLTLLLVVIHKIKNDFRFSPMFQYLSMCSLTVARTSELVKLGYLSGKLFEAIKTFSFILFLHLLLYFLFLFLSEML